jgi:hypothetical protein
MLKFITVKLMQGNRRKRSGDAPTSSRHGRWRVYNVLPPFPDLHPIAMQDPSHRSMAMYPYLGF